MHISNSSELMSWKMKFKPAANKASPGKPQQCLTAWRKWVPETNPNPPQWPWLTQPMPLLSWHCFPKSISAKAPIQHHLQSPASLGKKPNASSEDNWGFPGSMRTQKLRPYVHYSPSPFPMEILILIKYISFFLPVHRLHFWWENVSFWALYS